jgi:hypothetical protein
MTGLQGGCILDDIMVSYSSGSVVLWEAGKM